jgi:hypothetical protein
VKMKFTHDKFTSSIKGSGFLSGDPMEELV